MTICNYILVAVFTFAGVATKMPIAYIDNSSNKGHLVGLVLYMGFIVILQRNGCNSLCICCGLNDVH